MNKEFRPHIKQDDVLFDDTSKIVLAIAGKRGGKTTIGAVKFAKIIKDNINKGIHDDYLIVGPTYRLLRNATLPTLKENWLPGLGAYKKAESVIDLCDGHKVFIISAEDEDKIEGFKARAAWIDEAGQISRIAFDKVWQRTTPATGEERGQIIITTTPYGVPSSWLNKDLIEQRNSLGYVGYYNWSTSDNPYIDKTDIETTRGLVDQRIFKRDYEGIYTNIVGLIYPDFDRTQDVVSPIKISAEWSRYCGLDYGFSDPTAIVVFAKNPDKEEFILETSFYKSKADLDEIALFLNSLTNVKEVRYDPSAVAMMTELKKKCRTINLQPANNEVDPGIAKVTELFKKHQIKIFNINEEIIADLESYIYDEKRDKPKHENSHGPDAIRYCFTGSILYRKRDSKSRVDEALRKYDEMRRNFNPLNDSHWPCAPQRESAPGDKEPNMTYQPLSWDEF